MYKIGDKVETPYGVGVITVIRNDGMFFVKIKNQLVHCVYDELTPYRTAHEKLIEMEWEEQETTIKNNRRYDKGDNTIFIDIVKKTYEVYEGYDPYQIDLKLSRILTQYLEEIEQ